MFDPAHTIINAFSTNGESGAVRIGRIVGRHYTTVLHWQYSKDRGGTGGAIPRACQVPLIAAIKAERLKVKPELVMQRGSGE